MSETRVVQFPEECYSVNEFLCGCGRELDGTGFVSMRLKVDGLEKSVVLLLDEDEHKVLIARLQKWGETAFGPKDLN
jgi:hypothetical protein